MNLKAKRVDPNGAGKYTPKHAANATKRAHYVGVHQYQPFLQCIALMKGFLRSLGALNTKLVLCQQSTCYPLLKTS